MSHLIWSRSIARTGELRRGGMVIIDDDHGAVLAQAAETVTAQSLAALARLSNGITSLALTARRASVLKLVGAGPGIVMLPVARRHRGGPDPFAGRSDLSRAGPAAGGDPATGDRR